MNCQQAQERFSEFLDKTLNQEEAAAVRSHLDACAECQAEFRDFEKTVASLQSMGEVEPPAGFTDRVMDAVVADQAVVRRKKIQIVVLRTAASLAAAVVLMFTVRFFTSQKPPATGELARLADKRPGQTPSEKFGIDQVTESDREDENTAGARSKESDLKTGLLAPARELSAPQPTASEPGEPRIAKKSADSRDMLESKLRVKEEAEKKEEGAVLLNFSQVEIQASEEPSAAHITTVTPDQNLGASAGGGFGGINPVLNPGEQAFFQGEFLKRLQVEVPKTARDDASKDKPAAPTSLGQTLYWIAKADEKTASDGFLNSIKNYIPPTPPSGPSAAGPVSSTALGAPKGEIKGNERVSSVLPSGAKSYRILIPEDKLNDYLKEVGKIPGIKLTSVIQDSQVTMRQKQEKSDRDEFSKSQESQGRSSGQKASEGRGLSKAKNADPSKMIEVVILFYSPN